MDAAFVAGHHHKTATTINGVVINIHGDSHSTKVGKRVRREASFRVPPPPSFNGAGRASSPTSLSSASGSPYPGAPPPMNSVPVESVRARALQVRFWKIRRFFCCKTTEIRYHLSWFSWEPFEFKMRLNSWDLRRLVLHIQKLETLQILKDEFWHLKTVNFRRIWQRLCRFLTLFWGVLNVFKHCFELYF